ncbi:MAG: hypothetical protein LBB20_03020 [Puniceicoccales bacterium]|jgi:uncharacterized protein (UPF0335 family)|nr:hypothetical protein [Puniceicoccales bacterium]
MNKNKINKCSLAIMLVSMACFDAGRCYAVQGSDSDSDEEFVVEVSNDDNNMQGEDYLDLCPNLSTAIKIITQKYYRGEITRRDCLKKYKEACKLFGSEYTSSFRKNLEDWCLKSNRKNLDCWDLRSNEIVKDIELGVELGDILYSIRYRLDRSVAVAKSSDEYRKGFIPEILEAKYLMSRKIKEKVKKYTESIVGLRYVPNNSDRLASLNNLNKNINACLSEWKNISKYIYDSIIPLIKAPENFDEETKKKYQISEMRYGYLKPYIEDVQRGNESLDSDIAKEILDLYKNTKDNGFDNEKKIKELVKAVRSIILNANNPELTEILDGYNIDENL